MTLGVSNVSRIQFGFKFIGNPDLDPIIEYALTSANDNIHTDIHTQDDKNTHTDKQHHTTTVLRPFFRDHPGETVPEENFWTLWCKGRLTEADTPIIQLGATPSRLTSAHHHPPFFTGRMPFLPPNLQCQSTEGN